MKDNDTLSGLALKYYGSATVQYSRVIDEANRGAIGKNPNVIRPGIVLTFSELPPARKKEPLASHHRTNPPRATRSRGSGLRAAGG